MKLNLLKFGYALILHSVLFLGACNYNHKKTNSEETVAVPTFGVLSYSQVQSAVIAPKCLSCHSNAGGNKGGLNMESISNIRAKFAQIYNRSFETQDMPPGGPLSKKESDIFKAWLEAGAPEQAGLQQAQLPKGAVSYNSVLQFSMRSCLDCHSGADPEAHLDLSNYEVARQQYQKILDRTLIQKDMPPKPYPPLSKSEMEYLAKWLAAGLPK